MLCVLCQLKNTEFKKNLVLHAFLWDKNNNI